MLTAVVGINWGDEGKGRMVDLLSENVDIVARYQGGNNAGHTVINDKGKFILNLIPSGILRDDVVNVMGCGMVIDLEHLVAEIERLREGGINITPANLKISHRANICMPYHVMQDCLEEDRLLDKKYGSTRRGISPVYADKYFKKNLRMCDLIHPENLTEKVTGMVEWKNITIHDGYKAEKLLVEDMVAWLNKYGSILAPFITNVGAFIYDSHKQGKQIMFEAQLGALRDIDFGIYPYTSSSSTIAAYAPIGAGVPNLKLDKTIGIMKAYSSCVGEGPFVCEMLDFSGDTLRQAGAEYGAATGRPRRVGGFDVPASKYGCLVQGATTLALTKLDILSGLDKIPVCVAYDIDGNIRHDFPVNDELNMAKPVIDYLDGWQCDITGCRTFEQLPVNAQKYIRYIEKAVDCPIEYISVGADREQYIKLDI